VRVLVTGGAGFIGSSLCNALVARDEETVVFDNFSSGSRANLSHFKERTSAFSVMVGDVKSPKDVKRALEGIDVAFHFAANPEVRLNITDPETCFVENVVSTQTFLEAARGTSVSKVVFASSSTVYGDAKVRPTPEDYAPMLPISIYGACKLASEALVMAYAYTYGLDAVVLRFANIVGPRSKHGVVPDFIRKLKGAPPVLKIRGDGSQTKSYLHIDDCVSGIMIAVRSSRGRSVYNVGSEDQIGVKHVADIVCKEMDVTPRYLFSGGVDGGRGWLGDVKNMLLDTKKLQALGWKPKFGSAEAVRRTTREILGSRVPIR